MNNQINKQNWSSFEPEMIQSKPLSEKEKQKLSQIIAETKIANNKTPIKH